MDRAFAALGRGVVRFRWVILVVWLVAAMALPAALPSLGNEVNNNNSDFLPANTPSVVAQKLAKPLIGSVTNSEIPVIAVSSSGPLTTPTNQAALANVAQTLLTVPSVISAKVAGLSKSQTAAQILVTSKESSFGGGTGINTVVDNLEAKLAATGVPAGVQVHLAGQLAAEVASQKQSQKQNGLVQLFTILFIIVLLLIIFRALLAPLVTLLPAVVSLSVASALIGELGAHGLKISFFTQILLTVLLLGAGTDYGLFLVFRVREELLSGMEPREAVAVAVHRVGESISASAGTVIVALLTLLLAGFGLYHDLGVPLAIGIAVMLLAGLTLLPALLAIFGRAIFWPSKTAARDHRDGLWGRIAGNLVRRPALTLLLGIAVFGTVSVFVLGFKPGGFGGQTAAPAGTDAARGNSALAANFPQSSANPTIVVMRFPSSLWTNPTPLETATGKLQQLSTLSKTSGPLDTLTGAELTALHAQLGDAQTLPTPQPAGSTVPADQYYAYLATARTVSADGLTAQWEVSLTAGEPSSSAALNAVPEIRAQVASAAKAAGTSEVGVVGEAPAIYDISSLSDGDLRHIVPIAVLAIGLVLALVLRSLVAPLYLIASVVLSFLASLGVAVLVFITFGNQGGITFLLPFLMFIFLLALGEDYNILVMTRIREEAGRRPLREAVVRAVGATGPTVTSAGLVLAGTFTVLALVGGSSGGGSQIEEIGFGLAVGILLDTFVVRTVLVPSTVALIGRWNWWPSKMSHAAPVTGQQADPE